MNRTQLALAAGALLALPGAAAQAQGVLDQPLVVGFSQGVVTADLTSTANEMTTVVLGSDNSDDVPCGRSFSIAGVEEANLPLFVNTESDLNAVEIFPEFVHIVQEIRFCGEPGLFFGCARRPGNSITVAAIPDPVLAGVIYAHEFGHSTGLEHSDATAGGTPRPGALMNTDVGTFVGRELNDPECFSYLTQKDARGGGGFGDVGAPIGAEESAAPDAPQDVQKFVRGLYIHSIPLDRARRFGSENVPVLLRMLSDPAEVAHAANIMATLGVIGDTTTADAIVQFVRSRPDVPQRLEERQALTSAMMALGHLAARTHSAHVLDLLLAASDASTWSQQDGWWRKSPEMPGEMVDRARIGLALSGDERAHRALTSAMESKASDTARAMSRESMADLLRMNEEINRHGLDHYYGWPER